MVRTALRARTRPRLILFCPRWIDATRLTCHMGRPVTSTFSIGWYVRWVFMTCSFDYAAVISDGESNIEDGGLQLCIGRSAVLSAWGIYQPLVLAAYRKVGVFTENCDHLFVSHSYCLPVSWRIKSTSACRNGVPSGCSPLVN